MVGGLLACASGHAGCSSPHARDPAGARPLVALGFPLGVPAIVATAFLAGVGIEIFGVLWDMSMQQKIPPEKLSRVYSYDALGSFVLIPLGLRARRAARRGDRRPRDALGRGGDRHRGHSAVLAVRAAASHAGTRAAAA